MANKVQRYLMTLVMAVLVIAIFVGVFTATGLLAGVAVADDMAVEPRSSQINLSDFDVIHWTMEGHSSDLLSGRVYVYSYKDKDNNTEDEWGNPLEYFSMTQMNSAPDVEWKEWTLTSTRYVYSSLVRYRTNTSFNHEIEIYSPYENNGFTVREYGVEPFIKQASNPGRYTAQVVLDAQEGFTFIDSASAGTGTSAQDRGMKISIQNEGKRAVIEKLWYIVNYDNTLLDSFLSGNGQEVEFSMPSWKFGEGTAINYPLLRHGDELISPAANKETGDYELHVDGEKITEKLADGTVKLLDSWNPTLGDTCTHDIMTFTLANADTHAIIANNVRRSRWRYYINEYMPVGNYVLYIKVQTVTLGTHIHWFSDENGDDFLREEKTGILSDYIGFDTTYNFSVTPGTILMDDSALNYNGTEKAPIEINIANLKNNLDAFFAPTGNATFDDSMLKWSDIEGTPTYWGQQARASLYDEIPEFSYSLYRLRDRNYFPADYSEWDEYVREPSMYTVYYMVSMKNYDTYPALENLYENYYKVKVYEIIDVPTLNLDTQAYTGDQIIVGPEGADVSLFTWTGNRQTDAGEYTVTFTFINGDYYKWRNIDENNKVYDFNESYELDWTITPMVIEVPAIAQRYYTGNSITPAITIPKNQATKRDIFAITYPDGYSKGQFTEAGTYNITFTLDNSNNYVWESELRKPAAYREAAVSVPFIINKVDSTFEINPTIRPWDWGTYDKSINIVRGMASQGNILYTIYTDSQCTKPAAGLENFAVVNGVVTDATADAMGRLNAGEYYLVGKVLEGTNHMGVTSQAMNFTIDVARNGWDNSLDIVDWDFGEFDVNTNVITAKPLFGTQITLSILKRGTDGTNTIVAGLADVQIDENGKVLGDAAEILAGLDAGSYYLRATVVREIFGYMDNDASKPIYNYSELNTNIAFRISVAHNYWDEMPDIARWIIGENINLPTAKAHFGKPQFVVVNSDDEVIYDSVAGINKLAQAHPGWHTLTARVQATTNYTGLESSFRFRVFGTDVNFWLEVPNIQNWKVGETADIPTAKAAFGEVTFTYKTADGEMLGGKPTEAGEYIMIATAKSPEFEDMIAEVKFTIFPLTQAEKRETALIAVVSVFAVIIALGAVAATVVGVLYAKRKKANVQAKPFNENNGEI